MIQIGLTGWGDHPDVYNSSSSKKEKLIDYSAHFPIVELDATFYAIQPERNIRKWIEETPDNFRFIVKAYQGMTGHHRGELHMHLSMKCTIFSDYRLHRFKKQENLR